MPLPDVFLDRPGADVEINEALALVIVSIGREGGQTIKADPDGGSDLNIEAARVRILSANPKLYWRETDQGTDAKVWGVSVQGTSMFWFARNDADSAGQNFMRITRSGTTIQGVSFENGQVAIGTTSPNAAAKLEVASTTRGLLLPRMTTTQRDAISSPPDGLVIYNTTTAAINVRAGGTWRSVAAI